MILFFLLKYHNRYKALRNEYKEFLRKQYHFLQIFYL